MAVKGLRAGTEVQYKTREDGDKVWLKEIKPAPKQPTKPKDRPPLVKEPSHLKDKLKDKEMEKKDGAQDPKPNAK